MMKRFRDSHPLIARRLRIIPPLLGVLWMIWTLFFTSCRYRVPQYNESDSIPPVTKDSIKYLYNYHYTLGTNLIIQADTLLLAQLPIADTYDTLYRGDTVVVAEFMKNPADSIDSVWVKIAHNQAIQGWIPEKSMSQNLIPIHLISKLIRWFSHTHTRIFFILIAIFIAAYAWKRGKKGRLQLVFYHDIDSPYPILLCFLTAVTATLYTTLRMFYPQTWEHFYFNPTLNPFQVPFILSLFLIGMWVIGVVLLASVEEILKMLDGWDTFLYFLGLMAAAVICYLFFRVAVPVYFGYPLLVYFFYRMIRKLFGPHTYHYRCGRCGSLLKEKGTCPTCGALNK